MTALFPADVIMTAAAAQLHDREELLAPGQHGLVDLTIFISCYNEEEFIAATINTVLDALSELNGTSHEVIVVDDCSKDRSSEVVKRYIASHPDQPIILRTNKDNRGLAQNYLDVAFIGKGKYYRLICGDNAEPKETMVDVFARLGKLTLSSPIMWRAKARAFTGAYCRIRMPHW